MNNHRKTARCFIPVKNRGTVGVIQRTLVISIWTLLILVVISIALEIIRNPDSKWLNFFENFSIGSACSVVIVIITTIIQFVSIRNDKAKAFVGHITNIYILLYMIIEVKNEFGEDNIESYVQDLKNKTKEFKQNFEHLYWFSGEINELYDKVSNETISICKSISSDPAYFHLLNMSDIQEPLLNAYRFIERANPDGYNYLDGYAASIREMFGEDHDQL